MFTILEAWKRRWLCKKARRVPIEALTNNLSWPGIGQEAGKAGKTLYTFFGPAAYDTVWRDGLFYKLPQEGVETSFYESWDMFQRRVHECE
jgi:hypothetical protein